MTLRLGRSFTAAPKSLNRLMEIVSPATTLPAGAPINRAIRSPTLRGSSNQPCPFHDPISVSPHCRAMVSFTRRATAFGNTPSELPSR
jgi:hypothetical protein